MEWFYAGIGGIRQSDRSVAFKNIIISPELVGDLTYANATYQSSYGLIASEWKKENDLFKLTVTVPVNTSATIYLPADTSSVITEGGVSIRERKDVEWLGNEKGKAVVRAGSGTYSFIVKSQ